MTAPYPWLSRLWKQSMAIDKPCGILLSGAQHSGLETFVVELLKAKWEISDPHNHPDIIVLEGQEKGIGINEIRELVTFTQISPTQLPFKMVVIHPLDALTVAAQQSFLKTLEEALVPTYFLMITYHIHRILPTIKSRSLCMDMGTLSDSDISVYAQQKSLSFDEYDRLIAGYAPLYHERPDYPQFKQVFMNTLSGVKGSEAVSAEIQMPAMLWALTHALKRDPMNLVLQQRYTGLLDLSRLQETTPSINLSLHLEAAKSEA